MGGPGWDDGDCDEQRNPHGELALQVGGSLRTFSGISCCGSAGEGPDVVSVGMWVSSLASLSGLRIWCCHKLRHRSQL